MQEMRTIRVIRADVDELEALLQLDIIYKHVSKLDAKGKSKWERVSKFRKALAPKFPGDYQKIGAPVGVACMLFFMKNPNEIACPYHVWADIVRKTQIPSAIWRIFIKSYENSKRWQAKSGEWRGFDSARARARLKKLKAELRAAIAAAEAQGNKSAGKSYGRTTTLSLEDATSLLNSAEIF